MIVKLKVGSHSKKKLCSRCHTWKKLAQFKRKKGYTDGHFCWCKKCQLAYGTKYRKDNPTKKQDWYRANRSDAIAYAKRNYNRMKNEVYEHYGNKCSCCEETEIRFLTIDHKNGGGTRHKAEVGGGGWPMYRWIIKNDFPDELQLLCANCNLGKYRNNGICPHKNVEPAGKI